jgi:hypothetical protein
MVGTVPRITLGAQAGAIMNVDVSSEVVIDRPPSEVSDYASNPDRVAVWYVNIKSVEWKTARFAAQRPTMNLPRRLAAEGVGTAMLLAAVVGSAVMGERLAAGNDAIPLLANTIATGSTMADASQQELP